MDLDWRLLPEFAGLDLEDTRIVGWEYEPGAGRLALELEASVLPSHPDYVPGEDAPAGLAPGAASGGRTSGGAHARAQQARLVFDGVTGVSGLPLPPPMAWIEAIQAADRGERPAPVDTLGTLRREDGGVYRIDASFGPVRVRCSGATVLVAPEDAPEDAADDADGAAGADPPRQ